MATLPQAADYGPRVKLVSNRIDIPGSGELAVAEALERAAGTFTGMAIQHKEKDDALSYAHAKNEYLIADIEERAKLADDQDFATHGERYNEAMKGHYERLFPTVRSERDRGLFDAEARLQTARGTVAVDDNARTKEIDWNVAELGRHGKELQGVVMAAGDVATAQAAISAYLEHINSLLAKGLIDETQHEAWSRTWVTDVSRARVKAMDPKLREEVLERSIALARGQKGPITREQVAAGEGSGSIADFIPLDERVAMWEATKKGNEEDEHGEAAYAAWDEIRSTLNDVVLVGAAVRKASIGMDPKARAILNGINTSYRASITAEQELTQEAIMLAGSQLIRDGKSPRDVGGEKWMLLDEFQKTAMDNAYDAHQVNRQFGTFNVYSRPMDKNGNPEPGMSYAVWSSIPYEQKPIVTLDNEAWKMSFTPEMWAQLLAEQTAIRDQIASGKPRVLPQGMTNQQLVQAALLQNQGIPTTGRSDEQNEIYYGALAAMDYMVQLAQIAAKGPITNELRRKILVDMMVDKAYTDRDTFFGGGWFDSDYDPEEMKPAALMSRSERNIAFLHISGARVKGSYIDPDTKVPMTIENYLSTAARRGDFGEPYLGEISEKNMERAYFALERLSAIMSPAEVDAEILRRLKGE